LLERCVERTEVEDGVLFASKATGRARPRSISPRSYAAWLPGSRVGRQTSTQSAFTAAAEVRGGVEGHNVTVTLCIMTEQVNSATTVALLPSSPTGRADVHAV
jgi:hypothetical protein